MNKNEATKHQSVSFSAALHQKNANNVRILTLFLKVIDLSNSAVSHFALASCMHHSRLFNWHLTNSSITDVNPAFQVLFVLFNNISDESSFYPFAAKFINKTILLPAICENK